MSIYQDQHLSPGRLEDQNSKIFRGPDFRSIFFHPEIGSLLKAILIVLF